MFTAFVDRTIEQIMSSSADNQQTAIVLNSFEAPFEIRLRTIKEAYGESLVRTPTYKECQVSLKELRILFSIYLIIYTVAMLLILIIIFHNL